MSCYPAACTCCCCSSSDPERCDICLSNARSSEDEGTVNCFVLASCSHHVHLSCFSRVLFREGDRRRQACPVCGRRLVLKDFVVVRDELFPTTSTTRNLSGETAEDYAKLERFLAKFSLLEDSDDEEDCYGKKREEKTK